MQQKQFYVNTILLQGTEKHQIGNLALHLGKEQQQQQQKIDRRKEIMKIQAEISERNNSKDLKN